MNRGKRHLTKENIQITNRHKLLVICNYGNLNEKTVRCNSATIRLATPRTQPAPNAGEDFEKQEFSFIVNRNVKWYSYLEDSSVEFLIGIILIVLQLLFLIYLLITVYIILY